jgi:hypothetical protein
VAWTINRARTSIAILLGSFSSVSHTWVSGMGRSRKFRVRCKIVVLLVYKFFAGAVRWNAAIEESIYDCECVKQVPHRTEMGVRFRWGQGSLRESTEVGPLGRYEGATSVGQNQDQMYLALVTPSPKDSQRFSLKRMMWASDGDMFWQVLVVGSVLWGPSTKSNIVGWLSS